LAAHHGAVAAAGAAARMNGGDPQECNAHAASAIWVAVVLHVIPGLGAGYLDQRRWRAYWITSALAAAWFAAGAVLAQKDAAAAEVQKPLVGLIGLLELAAVSVSEADLAVMRVREGT
jgi:hypothetical protein